jgi:hypothetical protein
MTNNETLELNMWNKKLDGSLINSWLFMVQLVETRQWSRSLWCDRHMSWMPSRAYKHKRELSDYFPPTTVVLTNTEGLLNHNVPIQYIIQNIIWSQQKLLQIQLRSYKSGCNVLQQLTTETLCVCQCSHYVQQSLAEIFLKNWRSFPSKCSCSWIYYRL